MAAQTTSMALQVTSDADFRAFGNFIVAGMTAGGWTKLDGDINWTTVTIPAVGAYAGYEVWQSPVDGSLTRFYVKFRYGCGGSATRIQRLEVTVSFSYPGSGSSLSGNVSDVFVDANGLNGTPTVHTWLLTALPGELVITTSLGNDGALGWRHVIGRNRNNALNKIDQLSIFGTWRVSSSPTYKGQVITPTIAYGAASGVTNMQATGGNIAAGKVGASYVHIPKGGFASPMEGMLGFPSPGIGTANENITLNVYGVDRIYKIGAVGGGGNNCGWFESSSHVPIWLFE